jgi:small GTP-binding protein
MGNSEVKILLIGLDAAGKTTIMSRLQNPDYLDPSITPTIGFKKQSISRNGLDMEVIDMSGESKYRDLWKTNATNTSTKDRISGIIFVVDSTNKMRINVARSEL